MPDQEIIACIAFSIDGTGGTNALVIGQRGDTPRACFWPSEQLATALNAGAPIFPTRTEPGGRITNPPLPPGPLPPGYRDATDGLLPARTQAVFLLDNIIHVWFWDRNAGPLVPGTAWSGVANPLLSLASANFASPVDLGKVGDWTPSYAAVALNTDESLAGFWCRLVVRLPANAHGEVNPVSSSTLLPLVDAHGNYAPGEVFPAGILRAARHDFARNTSVFDAGDKSPDFDALQAEVTTSDYPIHRWLFPDGWRFNRMARGLGAASDGTGAVSLRRAGSMPLVIATSQRFSTASPASEPFQQFIGSIPAPALACVGLMPPVPPASHGDVKRDDAWETDGHDVGGYSFRRGFGIRATTAGKLVLRFEATYPLWGIGTKGATIPGLLTVYSGTAFSRWIDVVLEQKGAPQGPILTANQIAPPDRTTWLLGVSLDGTAINFDWADFPPGGNSFIGFTLDSLATVESRHRLSLLPVLSQPGVPGGNAVGWVAWWQITDRAPNRRELRPTPPVACDSDSTAIAFDATLALDITGLSTIPAPLKSMLLSSVPVGETDVTWLDLGVQAAFPGLPLPDPARGGPTWLTRKATLRIPVIEKWLSSDDVDVSGFTNDVAVSDYIKAVYDLNPPVVPFDPWQTQGPTAPGNPLNGAVYFLLELGDAGATAKPDRLLAGDFEMILTGTVSPDPWPPFIIVRATGNANARVPKFMMTVDAIGMLALSEFNPVAADTSSRALGTDPNDTPLLLFPRGMLPDARRFTVAIRERFGATQSHAVGLTVIAERTTETPQPIELFYISRSPFVVAAIEVPALLFHPDSPDTEIATYGPNSQGVVRWNLSQTQTSATLRLPPQAVGEAMEKINNTGSADPRSVDIVEGQAIDFRYGPPATIVIDPRPIMGDRSLPPWDLRGLFARADDTNSGTPLISASFELLYGLGAKIQRSIDPMNYQPLRVYELAARAGGPVGLSGNSTEYNNAWSAFRDALFTRLGLWRVSRSDQPTTGLPDTPAIFQLRATADLKWPVPGSSPPVPLPPSLAAFANPDGLAGGVGWAFDSANIVRSVWNAPNSNAGSTVGDVAFSALGGWGRQSALFDNRRTRINTTTTMGRVHRYKLERIGRIACCWHKARHVIVYERAVAPTSQFVNNTYEKQDRLLGRPVLRKVEEYIEILESDRVYPEGAAIVIASVGPVRRVSFPESSRKILVDGDWGRDVSNIGWEIPLWNANLASSGPVDPDSAAAVYPRPQINVFLLAADGKTELKTPATITNPEVIRFFTSTRPDDTDDTDAWPSFRKCDYCDRAEHAELSDGEAPPIASNMPAPAPARVLPGMERFTFSLTPGPAAGIAAGRAVNGPSATLHNITMMRSIPSVPSGAAGHQTNAMNFASSSVKATNFATHMLEQAQQTLTALKARTAVNPTKPTTPPPSVIDDLTAEAKKRLAGINHALGGYSGAVADAVTATNKAAGWTETLKSDPCQQLNARLKAAIQTRRQRVADMIGDLLDQVAADVLHEIDVLTAALVPMTDPAAAKAKVDDTFSGLKAYVQRGFDTALIPLQTAVEAGTEFDELVSGTGITQAIADAANTLLADVNAQIDATKPRIRDAKTAVTNYIADKTAAKLATAKAAVDTCIPLVQTASTAIARDAANLGTAAAAGTLGVSAAWVADKIQKVADGRTADGFRQALDSITSALTTIKGVLDGPTPAAVVEADLDRASAAWDQMVSGAMHDLTDKVNAVVAATNAVGIRTTLSQKIQGALITNGLAAYETALVAKITDCQTAADATITAAATGWQAAVAKAVDNFKTALVYTPGVPGRAAAQLGPLGLIRTLQLGFSTGGRRPLKYLALAQRDAQPSDYDKISAALDGVQNDFLKDADAACAVIFGAVSQVLQGADQVAQFLQDQKTAVMNAVNDAVSKLTTAVAGAVDQVAIDAVNAAEGVVTQANQAIDEARQQLADAASAAGQIVDAGEGLYQQGSSIIRLARAVGDPPNVPNLTFDRPEVGFTYDWVDHNIVNMTPTVAMVNRAVAQIGAFGELNDAVDNTLNQFGINLPGRQIAGEFLQDQLSNFNLGDIFKDFAGLPTAGLFDIKLPTIADGVNGVKVTHGIDDTRKTAFLDASVNLPFGSPTPVFQLGPIQLDIPSAVFTADARVTLATTGEKTNTFQGQIYGDWRVSFGGSEILMLVGTTLKYDAGGRLNFNIDPNRIVLADALQFLTDLMSAFDSGDSGFSLQPAYNDAGMPIGMAALLDLPIPDLGAGAFSITGLALHAAFEIVVAPDVEIGVRMDIGTRLKPFTLQVWILVGGGYFTLSTRYRPGTKQLTASMAVAVAAGVGVAFCFGPIAGAVAIEIGIEATFMWTSGGGSPMVGMSLFILIRGSVSVLGILTIDLTLRMDVRYMSGTATASGEIAVTIRISCFFKIEVHQQVTYTLAGSRQGAGNDYANSHV